MSESVQHYFVYAIVGFSTYQLIKPVLEFIYRKFFKKKEIKIEDDFSIYQSSCSKCNVKH